jgi:hypothetical protein
MFFLALNSDFSHEIPLKYSRLPLLGENIKEDLKSIQNTVNTMKEMNHPINSIWNHFQTSLEESIKRNVPIKTTREKR